MKTQPLQTPDSNVSDRMNCPKQVRLRRLLALSSLIGICSGGTTLSNRAIAQAIVNDNTLSTPSRVEFVGNSDRIRGGVRQGVNLFHSFAEFNVSADLPVFFDNIDPGVRNIISRVTGSNPSTIDGTLGVLGSNSNTVNLFLINPNGIILGQNARLLFLTGSFIATTANAVQFGDAQFSATSPTNPTPNLLNVNPSALLFNQISAQAITSRANRLAVDNDRSLVLVGGEVNLEGGQLLAPRGQVEIAAVTGPGVVPFTLENDRLGLAPLTSIALGNVTLSQGTLTDRALIDISLPANSSVAPADQGSHVQIQGNTVLLNDQAWIYAITTSTNPAGDITIRAADSVQVLQSSDILAQTQGAGAAGDLTIETGRLIVRDGSQIGTGAFSSGTGGNLTVDATESILLEGTGPDPQHISGLFVSPSPGDGSGNSVSLTITTGDLIIQGGAQVSASTFNGATGGEVTVFASNSVQILGTSIADNPSGIYAVSEGGSGSAGNVTITTGQLIAQGGGQVSTSTYAGSEGLAGNVTVTASESIQLSGTSATGRLRSGFLVGTTASQGAGNLQIQTPILIVDNGAVISAGAASTDGGNISVQASDVLLLRRGGEISATAGTAGLGGNGGNITLTAPFILGVLAEDSDISANAFAGNGGNIDITTNGIFGILPQPRDTVQSDITASSELGIAGAIVINTLEIDPNRGLVVLPSTLVDPSNQIAQRCSGSGQASSSLTVTGRGGLPPSPIAPLAGEATVTNWVTLNPTSRSLQPAQPAPAVASAVPIVEAQSWVTNSQGEVVLVAGMPTAAYPLSPNAADCNTSR